MAISLFLAVSSVFFRELPVRGGRRGVAALLGRAGWRGFGGKGRWATEPLMEWAERLNGMGFDWVETGDFLGRC